MNIQKKIKYDRVLYVFTIFFTNFWTHFGYNILMYTGGLYVKVSTLINKNTYKFYPKIISK